MAQPRQPMTGFSSLLTPYCAEEPLASSDTVNHVHLEGDAVEYSCPEAMEVQAGTRTNRKMHVVYAVNVDVMVSVWGAASQGQTEKQEVNSGVTVNLLPV